MSWYRVPRYSTLIYLLSYLKPTHPAPSLQPSGVCRVINSLDHNFLSRRFGANSFSITMLNPLIPAPTIAPTTRSPPSAVHLRVAIIPAVVEAFIRAVIVFAIAVAGPPNWRRMAVEPRLIGGGDSNAPGESDSDSEELHDDAVDFFRGDDGKERGCVWRTILKERFLILMALVGGLDPVHTTILGN
ncbi:hypothetical protein EJ03DRAFT_325576 [Teratosphaeria nubilosa]|uniref:Uncharacterized protein n=1 Tax=Teratosphaeria nubilosa TaxID=161662 RepID=A0A6G1LFB2_9PEZI|nr:hypothetical protein EJ03DRAFT_325576 [Teratosphaeria nubilosa]